MATRKNLKRVAKSKAASSEVSPAERIAGALALIAVRGMETDEAALKLDALGFTSKVISDLLDVGPNYVNVARHRRKASAAKAQKKKSA